MVLPKVDFIYGDASRGELPLWFSETCSGENPPLWTDELTENIAFQ